MYIIMWKCPPNNLFQNHLKSLMCTSVKIIAMLGCSVNNKSNKQIMVWLDFLTHPQLCILCQTPLTKETAWFVSKILGDRLTNLVIKDIG
jgi:hypothetical protein